MKFFFLKKEYCLSWALQYWAKISYYCLIYCLINPFLFLWMLDIFSGEKSSSGTQIYLVWSKILKVTQPEAQEISLRGDMFHLFIYFKSAQHFSHHFSILLARRSKPLHLLFLVCSLFSPHLPFTNLSYTSLRSWSRDNCTQSSGPLEPT